MAHIILFVTPAGLEDFFIEVGRPVQWGEFLPMHEPTEAEKKKLEQAANKHGQQLYPPDYLEEN